MKQGPVLARRPGRERRGWLGNRPVLKGTEEAAAVLHWQGETPRKGSRRDNCPRDAVRVPERVLLQGQVGFLILIPAPRFCRGTSLSKEQCVRGSVCGSGSAGSKGAAALGAGV